MQFEFAVLGAYQQAIITEFADMGIRMPGHTQSPVPQPGSGSGSGSGSNTGHSTPETPNPTTSTALIRKKNVGSGSGVSTDGYGTFVGGGPPPVLVPDPTNLCNCGCPNESGDLLQNGSAAQDAIRLPRPIYQIADVPGGFKDAVPPPPSPPLPLMSTTEPVRYVDGVVTIAETDLHSDGFGFPWGQTRSWTNGPGYATGSDNGNGWVDTYTPHLLEDNGSTNTLIFIANGNTAYYFDLVNGVYQPRIYYGSQLSYNSTNDTYTLIDTQGDQVVFDGFGSSWLSAQQGQLAKFISPGGETMAVTSYTSDGHIAEMQRSAASNDNTSIESWLYSYLPSGNANAGLLSGVTERTQVNGGTWTTVRQVQYS